MKLGGNQLSPAMLSKDLGLLLIRVVFGTTMLLGHGVAKWNQLWGAGKFQFADPLGIDPALSLGLAVLAEVGGSILVILGLLTRVALVPLICTMGVAFFVVHQEDGFSSQEKAILYGVVFMGLLLTGPGKISMDYLLNRDRLT